MEESCRTCKFHKVTYGVDIYEGTHMCYSQPNQVKIHRNRSCWYFVPNEELTKKE